MTKRDIALVLLRIDKRCGRDKLQTIERIIHYGKLHHLSAEVMYKDAERRLNNERRDARR